MFDLYSKYPDLPNFSSHKVNERNLRGLYRSFDGSEQMDFARRKTEEKIRETLHQTTSDEWISNNFSDPTEEDAIIRNVWLRRAKKNRERLKRQTGSDDLSVWTAKKTESWLLKKRIEQENRNYVFRTGLPMDFLEGRYKDPNELNDASKRVSTITAFVPNGKTLAPTAKRVFDDSHLTGDYIQDCLYPRMGYIEPEYVKKTKRKWKDSKGIQHERSFMPGQTKVDSVPDNSFMTGLDYLGMLAKECTTRAFTTSPCEITGIEEGKIKTRVLPYSMIAVLDVDKIPVDEYRSILDAFLERMKNVPPTYVLIHVKTKGIKTANLQMGWMLEQQESRKLVSEFSERLACEWNSVSPYHADECFTKYVYKNPMAFPLVSSFDEIPEEFERSDDGFVVVFNGGFTGSSRMESVLGTIVVNQVPEIPQKVAKKIDHSDHKPVRHLINTSGKALRTSALVANKIRHLVHKYDFETWKDLYFQEYNAIKQDKNEIELAYAARYFYETAWKTGYTQEERNNSIASRKYLADRFTSCVKEYLDRKSLSKRNWEKSRKETKDKHLNELKRELLDRCLKREISTIRKKILEILFSGRTNDFVSLRSTSSLDSSSNNGLKISSSTLVQKICSLSNYKNKNNRFSSTTPILLNLFLQNSLMRLRGWGNWGELYMNGSNSCSS